MLSTATKMKPRKLSKATERVAQREAQYLFSTYKRSPLFIKDGKGMIVRDVQGRTYIDMLGGIAVNALGYNHPRIVKALRQQAGRVIHTCNLFYHPYQGLLAERLVKRSGLARAFFTNSGTEAVEAAFKVAHAYAKKKGRDDKFEIVAVENSFHGRTTGALAATGTDRYRKPFEPLLPGVVFTPANDAAALQVCVSEHTSAIIMETIQGESGIYPMAGEFVQAARALCDRYDALLILDEIQCGLGRTGRYFCFQKFGVQPDLVTLAKPLAAGLPLGALLGGERVAHVLEPGEHGTTFGGGPLACRVALEFLDVLEEENLLDHVTRMGAYFRERLDAMRDRLPGLVDVRGDGLMIGIEFEGRGKALAERLLEAGFIVNPIQDRILRLLPPYIIEPTHIDQFVEALATVVSSLRSEPDKNQA